DEDIPKYDNFVWLTLGQLKQLMLYDNLVNMDTRTVISGIPFGNFEPAVVDFFNYLDSKNSIKKMPQAFLKSALSNEGGLHTVENIITFLTQLKSIYDLDVKQIPLVKMGQWIIKDDEIAHETSKFFKVIAV